MFDVLRFCEAGDYAGLADYLVGGFHNLAAAGAEFLMPISPAGVVVAEGSSAPAALRQQQVDHAYVLGRSLA